MDDKKLLVVIGASGVQGSSVVRAVLSDPELFSQYSIRGVSRDPAKAREKTKHPNSIEYVRADLNDTASLIEAFKGAHTVFGLTNFWELFNAAAEAQQGKNLADAAKAAGVKHLIWSAEYSAKKISEGKYLVAGHLDSKYEVSEYIESIKGSDMISTHVCVPFYMSNLATMFTYEAPDGVREWRYPWDAQTTKISYIDAARDVGLFVAGVMKQDPQTMNGRYVHAVSEWLTPNEIGEGFRKVKGKELRYAEVSVEEFTKALPPLLGQELPHQMGMVREFGLFGKGEIEAQPEHDKVLGGAKKSTWEEYLERDWDQDVQFSMLSLFT
jgi:uncharacterized protein YbjT (DUF2867 family)